MNIGFSAQPYNFVSPGRTGGMGAPAKPAAGPLPVAPSLPSGPTQSQTRVQNPSTPTSLTAVKPPALLPEAGVALGKLTALNQAAGRLAPLNGQQNGHQNGQDLAEGEQAQEDAAPENESTDKVAASDAEKKSEQELSPDEQREVRELRQRDMEVRAHEQAHVSAGGQFVTKAPSYDYDTGPDGRRYAVGGEVSIDTSPVPGDPAATMEKAQVVQRAALAPAEPSPQDQQVASEARRMEAQARGELLQENQREMSDSLKQAGEKAEGAINPGDPAARSNRLQQQFAGFFAAPVTAGFSQYA